MAPGDQRRGGLSVLLSDARGRKRAAPGLARWLARVAPAKARGVVGVALVSDATSRALNRRYRGHDHPTDVLSFPFGGAWPMRGRGSARFLGDIVIALGVARRQARAARHDQATELRVLALHGLLHLLGYDHDSDNGAMARLERRLRRKGRLREGLLERPRPAPHARQSRHASALGR
jgi:probable rRNA maturation factor